VLLILEGENLVPKAHKGEGFRISSGVRDRVLKEKSSILVRDAQMDDAFKGRMSIVEQKVHTMMAVPLQTKERIIGLIYVDSPFVFREFTKDDLSLLTVMANVAAIRIENARLAEIEQTERIMQRDLSQAAEIQGRMLPDKAPQLCRAPIWPGSTSPAAPWAAITTTSSPIPMAAWRWRWATFPARACRRR
jgi:phosphoserine phosphatase RsbU/P